jgi:ribosome recycling factor
MATEIQLTENDINGFQKPMEAEMTKAVQHFENELTKIRTGRAHTSLVEGIMVDVYGQPMPLKGLAVLGAPEPRMITVQPWDTSVINEIEKAIVNANLGVSPINDGKIIRLKLPEMSGSRREELLKLLGKKQEDCKIAIRNVRKDFHNLLRDAKKDKAISENFHDRLASILEKVTTTFCDKVDQMAVKKKNDITTV